LDLCSGFATTSGCSDSTSDCTISESESFESSESELSSEEESACACSSSRTGGRVGLHVVDVHRIWCEDDFLSGAEIFHLIYGEKVDKNFGNM
jgi:hypothetical protein